MRDIGQNNSNSITATDETAEVSMQVLQNMYAKITGKREQISRSVNVNHVTKFEDLENLHIKIYQSCEQYNIVTKNESIVIYHVDESKEQFSSFDRFRAYNKSSLSAIENIHFEYNILIKLPLVNEPQNYKITIDIHSRTSIIKKMQKNEGVAAIFFSMIADNTGNIKISYVDYTVAMNFMNVIDGWFNSLFRGKQRNWVKFPKKYSHEFSGILKLASLALFLTTSYLYYISNPVNLEKILPYSIMIFGGAHVLLSISGRIGKSIEKNIDLIHSSSYVHLNRGDEMSITEDKDSTNRSVVIISLNIILAFAVNIFSNYIWFFMGFK